MIKNQVLRILAELPESINRHCAPKSDQELEIHSPPSVMAGGDGKMDGEAASRAGCYNPLSLVLWATRGGPACKVQRSHSVTSGKSM